MNPIAKKIIGISATVFILLLAYYGTYLPLRKSQAFIGALRSLNSVRSLADFERAVSVPLDMPSPIGQEELVRNASNIVLNLIQQNDRPELVSELVNYIGSYYRPIIDRGRGMSFEQNIYILGALNEMAYIKTKQAKFLEAAKDYFDKGLKLGPKRPQFLYGLFDIYRMEGNVSGAKTVAEQILRQWPNDEKTRSSLADFLSKSLTKQK